MRKALLTLISAVALISLVACGGGSSNSISVSPAPTGGNAVGFSNANLNGNYVFALNGVTANNTFAVVGILNANGSGTITSGTRDTVNDAGGQALNESITGTYSINKDGRGQMILNGSSGQAIYYFVLSSSSGGKLFQNGTARNSVVIDAIGRLDAQSTPSTSLTGTYIVRLDGEDSNSHRYPYGAVGGLTASGSTLSGSIDENDSGTFNPLLPISSGSYSLSSNGRGTATYTTASGTANTASHHFIVYYVSPSRLDLISTDTNFFLHGYADQQTSFSASAAAFAASSPNEVFNISGYASNGPVVETGSFVLGSGTIATGVEDYNDDYSYATGSFGGGSFTVSGTGRWTATLNSTLGDNLVGWQVSPQQSLVLAYNPSTPLLETGDVRAQTLTGLSSASVSGVNYSQSFSGTDRTVGNFESTGSFIGNSSGDFAGAIDYQTDANGLTIDSPQTGFYSVDPTTGRGSGNISGVPVVFYTEGADKIYMIATDSNSLYQGTLTAQTP